MSDVEEDRVLTAKKVQEVTADCMFEESEIKFDADGEPVLPRTPFLAEGVVLTLVLDPMRVEKNKEKIRTFLKELPDTFHVDKGGGWSFLQACVDKDGVQWGEHRSVEALMCLGLATGFVKLPLPKEVWSALPGGLPYFMVDTSEHPFRSKEESDGA